MAVVVVELEGEVEGLFIGEARQGGGRAAVEVAGRRGAALQGGVNGMGAALASRSGAVVLRRRSAGVGGGA